jgi:hypothetical protein
MSEIMFRLSNLRLIGRDPTQDLGTHISQRLNHHRIGHAANQTMVERLRTPTKLVRLLPRAELLDGEIFSSLREAQVLIEAWRRH